MLYHLSYEGLTLGAGQFVEFIFTVKGMKYEEDLSSWHRNTNFKWRYDRRSGNCNYHLLVITSWSFPWNSPLKTVLVKAVNVHFNESRKKLCDYFVLLYCNWKKNIFNQEKTKKPYLLERYSHGAQLPLKVLRCSSFSKMMTWGLASKIRCVQQFLITCNGRMPSAVQELKNVRRMTYFFSYLASATIS